MGSIGQLFPEDMLQVHKEILAAAVQSLSHLCCSSILLL